VQWVYEAARRSRAERVVVATEDERIAQAVRAFGGEALMTSAAHESGTDRIAETAARLNLPAERIVLNVQGDEPQMTPELVDEVAELLHRRPDADMATAACRMTSVAEFRDPNVVKVVMNEKGDALYFSRASVPFPREGGEVPVLALRHFGIYAYRAGFLETWAGWPPCDLELTERLEQLRVLHHGGRIAVAVTNARPGIAIDTPEDLTRWRQSLGE
jgi:3-deoxy-manno-octulosonate cytidylyltransferase (CMP-KDO synthetase)